MKKYQDDFKMIFLMILGLCVIFLHIYVSEGNVRPDVYKNRYETTETEKKAAEFLQMGAEPDILQKTYEKEESTGRNKSKMMQLKTEDKKKHGSADKNGKNRKRDLLILETGKKLLIIIYNKWKKVWYLFVILKKVMLTGRI